MADGYREEMFPESETPFADALIRGWAAAIDRERRNMEARDQDRELDQLIELLERLKDAEARYERGEDATRAAFAALGDEHLLALALECRRLRAVLYPRLVPSE